MTNVTWASLAFGDIDNDNDLDLAFAGCSGASASVCNSHEAKIYINNGTTLTENLTWQSDLTGVNRGSLAFGDIDNDGDLDLVLTGCNSGGGAGACNNHNAFVYTNNGTTLTENLTWQSDLTGIFYGSIALGDLNNDGRLDLVLTGASSSAKIAKIYINNGTTLTENLTWQSDLTGVYMSSIALGDLNNDGRLDLVLTGSSSLNTRVYLNSGTTLVENSTWNTNLLPLEDSDVILGDIDSDGDLDLSLIGHTTGDRHRIYNNTGSTFTQVQQDSQSGGNLAGIFDGSQVFGDYDNDGDLDIVTTGYEYFTTLYKYDGSPFTGYTEDPEDIIDLGVGSTVVWSDLDNDGDLDLAITGVYHSGTSMQFKIYINNITSPNTQPNPPTGTDNFTASYSNNKLTLSWSNGSDTETPTLGLYYNLRVGNCIGCHDIVSGVFGGSSDPTTGYFGNMMQRKSIALNVPLNPNQTVYWSVQTIDTGLAKSSWSTEQNYTIPMDSTTPTIITNSPENHYNTSNATIAFNATVHDSVNLTNVSLWGSWGSWHRNDTNSSGINDTDYTFIKSLNGYGDGEYTWIIKACDNSSNCINSSIRTFRIDTVYPVINLVSPGNGYTWSSSNTVTFSYNVSDYAIRNCSLIINGGAVETDTSVTVNASQTFTRTLSNAQYTWSINCTDYAGHANNSETRSLTVSYTPQGGGPGGPGGSPTTPSQDEEDNGTATKTWAWVNNDANITFNINKPGIDVTEIKLYIKKAVSNIRITVTRLASRPIEIIHEVIGKVYQYLEINKTNLDDENIGNATIKFRINRTWIEQNDINKSTITLIRYNDTWQDLSTIFLEQNKTHYLFEAETPGFSVFAVKGDAKFSEQEPETVCNQGELVCSGNSIQQCNGTSWNTVQECELGCSGNGCTEIQTEIIDYTWVIVAALVIMVVIGVVIYKKKLIQ